MILYRELDPGEESKETDLFVKGMRPSASIRKILRPLGEWTADDIKADLVQLSLATEREKVRK